MLTAAEPHLERNVHPTVICRAYLRALDDAVAIIGEKSFKIDFDSDDDLMHVVESCIATKLTRRYGQLIPVRITGAHARPAAKGAQPSSQTLPAVQPHDRSSVRQH